MNSDALYAIKNKGKYLRFQGMNNEYSSLSRAWFLKEKSTADLLVKNYYPEGKVVKVKIEEMEGADE